MKNIVLLDMVILFPTFAFASSPGGIVGLGAIGGPIGILLAISLIIYTLSFFSFNYLIFRTRPEYNKIYAVELDGKSVFKEMFKYAPGYLLILVISTGLSILLIFLSALIYIFSGSSTFLLLIFAPVLIVIALALKSILKDKNKAKSFTLFLKIGIMGVLTSLALLILIILLGWILIIITGVINLVYSYFS